MPLDTSAPYAGYDHPIEPYVGDAFHTPDRSRGRVMALGINAYVSAQDWEQVEPGWFPSWIEGAYNGGDTHRFYRAVRRDLEALTDGLQHASLFRNRSFDLPSSLYATNVVKRYVPEDEGKRASQLGVSEFREGLDRWREELGLLARHGALPHLIVVFGAPFWPFACSAFGGGEDAPPRYGPYEVTGYEHTTGSTLHFVNRLRLSSDTDEHDLLLVRCAHPAARTRRGRPAWLLGQPAFREVVGLD